ncbi:heat shock 70 kDa protein 3-like [Rutidosis leptorrhynchoides]|uniref:heat shock 70 kDa protein 3-like n=1 Tax=Rutidosis leptorrhynchoides TaxID=125765 RepID=UPI003A98FD48
MGMHKNNVDDTILIGGPTRISKVQQMPMKFFDKKPLCKSIDPDEAVVYGVTVLDVNLSGQNNKVGQDLVFLNVTPLSVGIDLDCGLMSIFIMRNTPIPTFKKDISQ